LTTQVSFKIKDQSQAIRCERSCGPYFGSGDLALMKGPFNNKYACSFGNRRYFKVEVDDDLINKLTN
jgi:hypothetical protein